jgi:programmed cell death 6-interacting protein
MLALPFKQTKPVEWNRALHRFVSLNYSEGVADEHRTRFEEVHELRLKMEKIGTNVDDKNADKLRETLVKYHALLSSLSSRFGETGTGKSSMNVTFEWKDCFSTQHRSSQPDIRFERACVLWNLAAVTSVLGLGTRRLDGEGIKKACHLFQQAAGIISQVAELAARCEWVGCTADMSGESLECMQQLMLAQVRRADRPPARAHDASVAAQTSRPAISAAAGMRVWSTQARTLATRSAGS